MTVLVHIIYILYPDPDTYPSITIGCNGNGSGLGPASVADPNPDPPDPRVFGHFLRENSKHSRVFLDPDPDEIILVDP